MNRLAMFAAGSVIACIATAALAQDFRQPSPPGAKVYFIEPKDGAEISGPVTVKFGPVGMGVAPRASRRRNRPPSPADQ
jgi:hypothetical protein